MSEKPFRDFSEVRFELPVWNIMPLSQHPLLIIESRNEHTRVVSFSAWNYHSGNFMWKGVILPEKWWVTLHGASAETVVLKVFDNSDNPDKTSFLFLDLKTGKILQRAVNPDFEMNQHVLRPFQYIDGEEDFDTIKNFLQKKLQVHAVLGAEYLETGNFIFISYYKGAPAAFVNRFCVFDMEGSCLLDEEIGTNLKGIGWNTFFIVSDRVFFVKNKMELVTFRIV